MAAALTLLGSVSIPTPVVLGPVGPNPAPASRTSGDGVLTIYTARQQRDVYPNLVDYVANNRWDRVFFAAHKDYTLRTSDGKLYRQVRNSRGLYDRRPTLVRLPPGTYEVQAQAEDSNDLTFPVEFNVIVEPGRTTTVFLAQDWEWKVPKNLAKTMVSLPNGRNIGWRAELAAQH